MLALLIFFIFYIHDSFIFLMGIEEKQRVYVIYTLEKSTPFLSTPVIMAVGDVGCSSLGPDISI